jgi:hypothetical protein
MAVIIVIFIPVAERSLDHLRVEMEAVSGQLDLICKPPMKITRGPEGNAEEHSQLLPPQAEIRTGWSSEDRGLRYPGH